MQKVSGEMEQTRWQHEGPYREELELVRHSNEHFESVLMRAEHTTRGSQASGTSLETASSAYGQEDEGQLSCAGYFKEEHGLTEADHRTSRRNQKLTLSYVCPHCHCGQNLAGLLWARKEAVQLVVCGLWSR